MKRFLPHIACVLFVGQLLLMLVSWLLSAAFPDSGIHSLISGEGLRWFWGHFTDSLASPVLVWLLLLSIAYGCVARCGINRFQKTYRETRALLLAAMLLFACVGVIVLLSAIPHAVLLSATGTLWPSPFSAAIVPLAVSVTLAVSSLYGTVAGYYESLSEVYDAMLYGIRTGAPFLLFYVLIAQLVASLCYLLP